MAKQVVLTGNYAAAEAAALCRPEVIAAYPMTPQSSIVERLSEKVYNGELDAEMIQVECEHSAMSAVQGAAAGGGRVFTATAAQGLALMYEPYFRMSTLRLPMVMALATREMTSPETVWSGQQDAMSVREAGWIQIFCESNQEIVDMIIQAYRLAEDPRIRIPVNVCFDGFYSSHLTEGVWLPEQADVDAFLPDPRTSLPALLNPDHPLSLDPLTAGPILMKYRKDHLEAMTRVLPVLEEIDLKKLAKLAGRKNVEMIHQKDLLPVTGYMRGGCSPVGMKKQFPTYMDESILNVDEVAFSAGKRGFQMIVRVQDILAYLNVEMGDIIRK